MKVKKINLKNIGVFEDETIEFPTSKIANTADIHIFTGINGSGKSTILYAIASIFDFFEKDHKSHISNFFYKRFRYFEKESGTNSKNKTYKSEVTAQFRDKSSEVCVYGCPICKSIHSTTENSKINTYRTCIISKASEKFEFEFATFAYSGYRFIKSTNVETLKTFTENPLEQSLEFVKKYSENTSFSFNQWILNNFSNEAILYKMGQIKESEKFASSLSHFKRFLAEVIEKEIDFIISVNPIRLYLEIDEQELDFDVLPDGLRSLISWIGDLMMVMDNLNWKDNVPIFERSFILLLDEIEVHLHPSWQRKILPVLQKLFTNAQIFVSTHSPYIVNSVDGAFLYELDYNNGNTIIKPTRETKTSDSISYTLKKVFGMKSEFGEALHVKLDKFYSLRDNILKRTITDTSEFVKLKKELLAIDDLEVSNLVEFECKQLFKITQKQEFLL
ncbi:MAG: AAA family ATPase [Chitinophagales bacterium]